MAKEVKGTGLITDIFRTYYDARHNKRNTINALAFEIHPVKCEAIFTK